MSVTGRVSMRSQIPHPNWSVQTFLQRNRNNNPFQSGLEFADSFYRNWIYRNPHNILDHRWLMPDLSSADIRFQQAFHDSMHTLYHIDVTQVNDDYFTFTQHVEYVRMNGNKRVYAF